MIKDGKTLKVRKNDFEGYEALQVKLAKARMSITAKIDLFNQLIRLGNKHFEELKDIN